MAARDDVSVLPVPDWLSWKILAVRELTNFQPRCLTWIDKATSSISEYPEKKESNTGSGNASRRYIVQVVFSHSTPTTSGNSSLSSGSRLIAGPITFPANVGSDFPFIRVKTRRLIVPGL